MSRTCTITSRASSEMSGSLPGKKPCEARTSATGQAHAAHLFGGGAGRGHRRRVLFRRRAGGLGVVAALDLPEVVEVVVGEVGRQVVHRQAPVREPEVEVGLGALEDHVQAPEGPREALLQGLRLLLSPRPSSPRAGLSTRGQPPSSRTRARTRSGYARAVFRATKAPMECPSKTASLQPEVVEDADHVGGVRFEAVAGLRFVRVAPAAQVDADEPARWPKVARRRVEGPVLGRDAVQADDGVGAFSGAAISRVLPRRGRVRSSRGSYPWAGIIREGVRRSGWW